jgi:hypothetical protein
MKLSMAARVLSIGVTVAMMTAMVGSTAGYAHTHKAKAKSVLATTPQYVPQQQAKLRYYGGPKSPMYL